jgi:glyoxylase-like metal-dependent hydrolase (beta-lactamase superfamily II)
LNNKLTKFSCLVAAGLAVASACVAAAAQTQTDIHRDAATRNTGGDALAVQYARAYYCNLPDNNNGIVVEARGWNNQTGTGSNAQYRIPLTQIFDDVWAIGNHYVVQYIIKTPDGLVQVDTSNSPSEFQLFDYQALLTLGLSPSYPLKEIFLTHGHGDHDGGAQWALDNLGARSVLGSADINLGGPKTYNPVLIDSTDLSMRTMSIGGKNFWIMPTPGHTPGATSAVLEVKDWGQTRRVLINGGQSMTNSISDVQQYLDSIERTYAMVQTLNVEGVMTPHIYWDGEGSKLDEINAKGRTNPSQNIFGHEQVARQMAIARECSAAWLTQLDSTASFPVWRYNSIDFAPASPIAGRFSAKVTNGWGPLPHQQVTFKHDAGGETCAATTDATGTATCGGSFGPFKQTDSISVSFAGSSTTDFVDLPAQKSAPVGNGCSDLAAAKTALGTKVGSPSYVSRLDVDGNGVIDVRDVAGISRLMASGTVCH